MRPSSSVSPSRGRGHAPIRTGKAPFEAIVAEHGSRVLRVCRAVVGPVDADDAWSETFLAAMRAYPDLPATASVEAWLVTIAHRKAIDLLRATSRRAEPTAEIPERGGTEPDLAGERLDDDLVGALARLPEKQRFAVVYHHLGGLPYAQIATILGGSTDAARRAAADGMANLRRNHPAPRRTKEPSDARRP